MPETENAAGSQCSKCGKALDTNGFPHWCKKCRATYKREYEALKGELAETRGYAAGVSAMREFVAANFELYTAPRVFTGAEIAYIVRTCAEPVAPAAEPVPAAGTPLRLREPAEPVITPAVVAP